jgi:hypothetical protein
LLNQKWKAVWVSKVSLLSTMLFSVKWLGNCCIIPTVFGEELSKPNTSLITRFWKLIEVTGRRGCGIVFSTTDLF